MKKLLIALIIIFVIIIVLPIILLVISKPRWFYYRYMFHEDRVKISTKIYIDDELIDINQEKIKISGDGIGKKSISKDGNNLNISFKGNKYSNYDIDLYAKDYKIKIVLNHWNWWDINRINAEIRINTKENTISYNVTNKFISEEKEYTEDEVVISDTKELSEINTIGIQ